MRENTNDLTNIQDVNDAPTNPKPTNRGSKGKYNAATKRIILDALSTGNLKKTAASVAGITEACLYAWIKDKPGFAEEVAAAEQKCLQECIDVIKTHGKNDWRAAAWIAERKEQQWIKQDKLDISSNGKEISFTIDFGKKIQEEDTGADTAAE